MALLAHEVSVNVRNDSSSSDGSLDQSVQLLVSTNGEVKMARSDPLDLEVLRGIASELENLRRQ